MIPPPAVSNGVIPQICYSNRPAEMILFDGKPVYSPIPGTQLVYSTNTSSYLFRHNRNEPIQLPDRGPVVPS